MNWIGTVVGGTVGFLVGGPVGAVFGASFGHQVDKGNINVNINQRPIEIEKPQRVQEAFFTATFSVMGHIAKASGRVSPEEIAFANRLMTEMAISGHLRATAISLFQQGKKSTFPLDVVLKQFYKECCIHTSLLHRFVEIQLQTAIADGVLENTEEEILLHICQQLKISRLEYNSIKLKLNVQQHFQNSYQSVRQKYSLKEAYGILNLKTTATPEEVKKAYRRLMSKYHPDKLAAKGLPEEEIKVAKEKTQEINKAYEIIQKSY